MITHIRKYIDLQSHLVEEIQKKYDDLWDFEEEFIFGWECYSHGEHICCIESNSQNQIEIPLLAISYRGIDPGHFIYYLKSSNIEAPSYSEMTSILERYEKEGLLVQVQSTDIPIIWDIKI